MLEPLSARQTLDRARAIMQAGRGAALPELLKIIETLSLNLSEVTISELGELIEKDAVVLAKIISVANTLAHNPGISPLATLSQAIHQVGYNRIRTIAVSLMLLDTAGAANPPEQRDAAAHALCAGLLAQGAAEQLGTHDPEFVFACAALRNFGPIMFAAVSAEHCRAAAKRFALAGPATAYRAQFGLTPLEFTRRLLTAARLPDDVLETLRDCEPESLAGTSTTHATRLLGLADYGSRLATLTLEARRGSDAFAAELRALARRFDRLVPGAFDLVRPALQRADERLRQFSGGPGARSLPAKSLARIDWRLGQLSPAEIAPDRGPADPADSTADAAFPGCDPLSTDILDAAADSTALSTEPPLSASASPTSSASPFSTAPADPFPDPFAAADSDAQALLEILGEIRRDFAAQECWLFRPAPGEKLYSPAHSLGHAAAQPSASVRLDPAERSVFGVCLQRREIVLIHDASRSPHLPRWFRQNLGAPAAFALIPSSPRGDDASPALLLVGWSVPRRIALTPAQLSLARRSLSARAAHLVTVS